MTVGDILVVIAVVMIVGGLMGHYNTVVGMGVVLLIFLSVSSLIRKRQRNKDDRETMRRHIEQRWNRRDDAP